jgi:hypothetical protein
MTWRSALMTRIARSGSGRFISLLLASSIVSTTAQADEGVEDVYEVKSGNITTKQNNAIALDEDSLCFGPEGQQRLGKILSYQNMQIQVTEQKLEQAIADKAKAEVELELEKNKNNGTDIKTIAIIVGATLAVGLATGAYAGRVSK